jgi:trimeric autotransporter adhesin
MKKKAIKLAAASAVAASAFVASAPAQTDAATNVATEVSKAVTQMKKAYHTYSDVTAKGEFADLKVVYKEYNAAKTAYNNAKALVNKAGGSKKDAYLAELDSTYADYITKRVVTYIDAYNYATKLDEKREALEKAIEAKDLAAAEKYYHEISYELKSRTVILDRVYGQTTRELLRKEFKGAAQDVRDSLINDITVVTKLRAADEAIKKGDLATAEKALEVANEYLPKVTETFKAELTAENTKVKAAYDAATTPKVESVSAINGKQLIVKFNKEVDENFLGTYTLSDGKTVSSTELQEDGKSVKLTLNTAYDNTKAHNVAVTVQNAKVKGTVDTFFPVFTQVISVEDKVKAEIASVEAVTKGDSLTSFKVKFTEPVQPGATFKVNGESVSSAILGAGNQEATITVSSPIKVGVTHKLEVINLTDTAGNVNAVATKEFTISQDSTAPYVNSVEAYGDNKLLVTFSKKMKSEAADLTNMQNNIDVRNDTLNPVTVDRVIPLAGDKTGTKFVVELNRTSAASLFSSTKTSHNLTVLFKNDAIEDSLGNKLAGVTKTVTLVKDTVAPEITSVTFKKNSEGKVTSLVVKFSEGVKANGSLQFPTTLVNDKGVLVTTASVFGTVNPANVAEGAKEAEFTLATPATVSGKYSISFAKGFVQDTSLAYNDSKVYNTVLDFGTAQTSGEYTIPEANVSSSIDPATNTTTIKVVFPEAVKGGLVEGSATDVSRYTLNGRALPAGTTITLNPADSPVPGTAAQTIATIVLPEQSIEKYDNAAVFTINGVVSLSGKVNKSFTKAIEVQDNVSPVLQSAKVLDNKTIELTYSENIAALSNTNVGTEFKIYQGTTALTLADSELKANSVSGFPTKIRLTVAQGVDAPATPATKATATVDFGTVADDTDALTLTAKTAGTGGNGIVVKFVNAVANGTTNATYDAGTKTLTVELADDGTTSAGNVNATTADVVAAINGATGTPVDAAVVNTGAGLAAVVGDATTANGADEIPATSATTLDLTKDLFVETLVPASGVDVLDARGNKQKADVKISVSK